MNSFFELSENVKCRIEEYVDFLMAYNKKINLVSRKITDDDLSILIGETVLLEKYLSNDVVVDVGSGNGILGIPIAIINNSKKIILIERKLKKVVFLNEAKLNLNIKNIDIFNVDIKGFIKENKQKNMSLVARGFPANEFLLNLVSNSMVNEVIIITSKRKIKKNLKSMENVEQKIYNIPFREELKILKMENVSRETVEKKV